MKKFALIITSVFALFFLSNTVLAQNKKTPANAFGLVGSKSFTLQWLGKDKFGKVKISPAANGRFTIQGKLTVGEDFCLIDGLLTPKDENIFLFVGKIETKVSYLFNGNVCLRESSETKPYTFEKKNGRKYYRLQQMQTCDSPETVDYIDIFEW
jgi:hypothetical protein